MKIELAANLSSYVRAREAVAKAPKQRGSSLTMENKNGQDFINVSVNLFASQA